MCVKKLFPLMYNRIGTGQAVAIYIYWFMAFIFVPFAIPFLAYGLWNNRMLFACIECCYYALNAIVMAVLLKEHLKSSYYYAKRKNFIHTLLITCGLMFTVVVLEVQVLGIVYLHYTFPLTNFEVMMSASETVAANHILGTIAVAVFSPIAISGLFYAPCFAPICGKRPWLAYLAVSLLLLSVSGFDILWRDNAVTVLILYALRLPIHLLACWSYEKTDSIWTPIGSLAVFNLLFALLNIAGHCLFN